MYSASQTAPPLATAQPSLRLPLADLVVLIGVVVFGTNLIEVTMRGGALGQLVGPLFMACYLTGILFAVLTRALPQALIANPLLAALIILPVASALWSVDGDITLYRSLMLIGTTAFGLFIGWHYERRRMIMLLAIGVSINMLISTFLIVAVPSIGIDQTEAWAGTWIGAFMHKNGFGAAIGVAMLVLFYALAVSKGVMRLGFAAVFALSCVLLIGSRSSTALVVTIVALLMAFGFLFWQRARGLMLAIGLACLIFLPLAVLLAAPQEIIAFFFDSLEKDMTVSGRTEIWQLVWPYITDRFWFGYGYGSFWQPGFPWFNQIQARLYYAPYYSHNGIVELWIAGGAVTVIIAVLAYLGALFRSLILALREQSAPEAAFAFIFMVSFAIRNITEASLVQGNDLLWLLFVAFAVSTSKSVVVSFKRQPPAGLGST